MQGVTLIGYPEPIKSQRGEVRYHPGYQQGPRPSNRGNELSRRLTPAPELAAQRTTEEPSKASASVYRAPIGSQELLEDDEEPVDDASEPPSNPRKPPIRKIYAHHSDPSTFYEFVNEQRWGALEEQIYNWLCRNEPVTSGYLAAAIKEHTTRVGRAVTASRRLIRVGGKISILPEFLPSDRKLLPSLKPGTLTEVDAESGDPVDSDSESVA